MKERRKKREKQIEAIFNKYNGSAILYSSPKISNRSIANICSTGSTVPKEMTVSELINEVRQ